MDRNQSRMIGDTAKTLMLYIERPEEEKEIEEEEENEEEKKKKKLI